MAFPSKNPKTTGPLLDIPIGISNSPISGQVRSGKIVCSGMFCCADRDAPGFQIVSTCYIFQMPLYLNHWSGSRCSREKCTERPVYSFCWWQKAPRGVRFSLEASIHCPVNRTSASGPWRIGEPSAASFAALFLRQGRSCWGRSCWISCEPAMSSFDVVEAMPFLPAMTGNGNHTTYEDGEIGDGLWHCFTHIANEGSKMKTYKNRMTTTIRTIKMIMNSDFE